MTCLRTAVVATARGVIRKENDEEEFMSKTDMETKPVVVVMTAMRFNEAQKLQHRRNGDESTLEKIIFQQNVFFLIFFLIVILTNDFFVATKKSLN